MARFRIDDAFVAGQRFAVSGEVLDGVVHAGMVARGPEGFEHTVNAIEHVTVARNELLALAFDLPDDVELARWRDQLERGVILEVWTEPAR
jgi:hypothetical protein